MVDFPPTEQVLQECLQVKHGIAIKHHQKLLFYFACLTSGHYLLIISLAGLNVEIKSTKNKLKKDLFLQVLHNF